MTLTQGEAFVNKGMIQLQTEGCYGKQRDDTDYYNRKQRDDTDTKRSFRKQRDDTVRNREYNHSAKQRDDTPRV